MEIKMEIKFNLRPLMILPGQGGVIVREEYGPGDEGVMIPPPYVFTDHEALCKFLYTYFVDTEAELKKRAEDA